jgi:5-methylcytosine-specific restriction endonuclease McrA
VLYDSHRFLCPRPDFITESFKEFEQAVRVAVQGDLELALSHLSSTRHDELRVWFDKVAQHAGKQRFLDRNHPMAIELPVVDDARDEEKISVPLARQILERDAYHCRYCGIPVVFSSEVRKIQKILGPDNFPISKSNQIAHGTLRAFYNSFDHVLPRSRGGRNTLENLVTACYPCNFGKDDFTLSQLGLRSPFEGSVVEDNHDGFVSLLSRA